MMHDEVFYALHQSSLTCLLKQSILQIYAVSINLWPRINEFVDYVSSSTKSQMLLAALTHPRFMVLLSGLKKHLRWQQQQKTFGLSCPSVSITESGFFSSHSSGCSRHRNAQQYRPQEEAKAQTGNRRIQRAPAETRQGCGGNQASSSLLPLQKCLLSRNLLCSYCDFYFINY